MRVSSNKLHGGPKRFSRVNRPTQLVLLAFFISIFFTVPMLRLFGLSCRAKDNSQAARLVSTALTQNASILHELSSIASDQTHQSHIYTPTDSPPKSANALRNAPTHNTNTTVFSQSDVSVTTGFRADWGPDVAQTHPFCNTMATEPLLATAPLCKRKDDMSCAEGSQAGKTPFFSQVGQDYYVYTRHFKNLKRKGVYLEAGTRHPITGSNTYFMDACMRWQGVCVEGNPHTLAYIHRSRSCELVPTCVSQFDGSRRVFVMKGKVGRIEGMNGRINSTESPFQMIMPCLSLLTIFERRNIKVLDYLSLDVDGHELDVLKGMDHKRHRVNVITVATMPETISHIQEYLEALGYVRHVPDLSPTTMKTGLLRQDAIFVHRLVSWGSPV